MKLRFWLGVLGFVVMFIALGVELGCIIAMGMDPGIDLKPVATAAYLTVLIVILGVAIVVFTTPKK